MPRWEGHESWGGAWGDKITWRFRFICPIFELSGQIWSLSHCRRSSCPRFWWHRLQQSVSYLWQQNVLGKHRNTFLLTWKLLHKNLVFFSGVCDPTKDKLNHSHLSELCLTKTRFSLWTLVLMEILGGKIMRTRCNQNYMSQWNSGSKDMRDCIMKQTLSSVLLLLQHEEM